LVNSLAGFAQRHPTLTKGLMLTFGALSLLATIGGGVMIAAAGSLVLQSRKLRAAALTLMSIFSSKRMKGAAA